MVLLIILPLNIINLHFKIKLIKSGFWNNSKRVIFKHGLKIKTFIEYLLDDNISRRYAVVIIIATVERFGFFFLTKFMLVACHWITFAAIKSPPAFIFWLKHGHTHTYPDWLTITLISAAMQFNGEHGCWRHSRRKK